MKANPFYKSAVFAGRKVHVSICGSVACYKMCDFVRSLLAMDLAVSVTLTAAAQKFISPLLLKALGADPVYGQMFEGDAPFAHLEPGHEADLMLVAPASADMLAKMAQGLCEDLAACQYVAYGGKTLVAPAMNPAMWAHPATCANARVLADRNVEFVGPAIGKVACGDQGAGRLAEPCDIFLACLKALSTQDMAGLNVLVTLGPTREYWDGVRFWSNPSSGLMGSALVTAAWLRGADVWAVCGPEVDVQLPGSINRIDVTSADEMYAAAMKLWPEMTIGICCAAVADFAPVSNGNAQNAKISKNSLPETFTVEFRRNHDILAALGKDKGERKLLGFAAQIAPDLQALAPYAHEKLGAKNADLIAANRVNGDDGAFGSELNTVLGVDRSGEEKIWQALPKADIAWNLLTCLLKL